MTSSARAVRDPRATPAAHTDRRWLAAVCAIAFVALVAYSNSFSGVFLWDDEADILGNPNVRSLWPLSSALDAPAQSGLVGRPVASLSFALNYALSGYATWSYHAFNLAIHLASALLLFGCVRRTLLAPTVPERLQRDSVGLAAAVALLWVAHPLQTESVMFIVQRVESLMGLCFLATLYCAARGFASETPRRWFGSSVAACVLAIGTKEVAVAAPLVVLLYDRTFWAGTFRDALVRRKAFYAGLALAWGVLAALMLRADGRSDSVGFGDAVVTPWTYLTTQAYALAVYLRLAFVPHPLVFDYGLVPITEPARWLFGGLLVTALLAATCVALWRAPALGFRASALGFLGACFFLVLAPTSSFVPIFTELMTEHRMYLPLVSVLALVVFAGHAALERGIAEPDARRRAALALVLAATAIFGTLTWRRNRDYADAERIWASTVAAWPGSDRGQNIYGIVLRAKGRIPEASQHFRAAVQLAPWNAFWRTNLATSLVELGQVDEALEHYQKALEFNDRAPLVHTRFGEALLRKGDVQRATAEFSAALALDPADAAAHRGLGSCFAIVGRPRLAAREFRATLEHAPNDPEALRQLGWILVLAPFDDARNGREALEIAERLQRAHPGEDPELVSLAAAGHAELGEFTEAVTFAGRALELARGRADAARVGEYQRNLDLYRAGKPLRSLAAGDPPPERK